MFTTVLRIRRKRVAEPVVGLVVSKRPKTDFNSSSTTKTEDNNLVEENGINNEKNIIFRLVGTSSIPHAKAAAPFLDKEHKVVEMIDYNVEENAIGKRHVSVLDEEYLEVMQAANAISSLGFHGEEKEQSKLEFEEACTAPLAKAEDQDDDIIGSGVGGGEENLGGISLEENKDYVYDFYSTRDSQIRMEVDNDDELNVRLPTDEEMILFYGGDHNSSEESCDGDSDSNNENYYKNDYPDEDEFRDIDNDSTTDEDCYDHYGDEDVEYRDFPENEYDDE